MAELAAPIAIHLRDLVVGFGDQTVLDHLALDLRDGEILGVVGASGSGKSVLLRAMLGLVPKRLGRIEIFGVDRDLASAQELLEITRAGEKRFSIRAADSWAWAHPASVSGTSPEVAKTLSRFASLSPWRTMINFPIRKTPL